MRIPDTVLRSAVRAVMALLLLALDARLAAQSLGDMPVVDPPQGIVPLPVQMQPNGVLFRLQAPGVSNAYVLGSFNAWGDRNGMDAKLSDDCRMFGPDEKGVFEFFYPMTPGTHAFAFCLDGNTKVYGPRELPKAGDVFGVEGVGGKYDLKGSIFQFQLGEPPWPSYVPNHLMMPAVVPHPSTGQPALRVRYFTRVAKSVHCVGNWDSWAGGVAVIEDTEHRMAPTRVRNVWEYYISPINEGILEYKFVVDTCVWIPDPTVYNTNSHGNSLIQVSGGKALYTPRFNPYQQRADTETRWGGAIKWVDYRQEGFARAQMEKQPMLWVITLPGSALSRKFMETVNADQELVGMLGNVICLETPAHEVRDIMEKQNIYRLPYAILVNSQYKPEKSLFNPSVETLKDELKALK